MKRTSYTAAIVIVAGLCSVLFVWCVAYFGAESVATTIMVPITALQQFFWPLCAIAVIVLLAIIAIRLPRR